MICNKTLEIVAQNSWTSGVSVTWDFQFQYNDAKCLVELCDVYIHATIDNVRQLQMHPKRREGIQVDGSTYSSYGTKDEELNSKVIVLHPSIPHVFCLHTWSVFMIRLMWNCIWHDHPSSKFELEVEIYQMLTEIIQRCKTMDRQLKV